ncbi:MAG: hypothetical protein U0R72_05495 [Nakamurella multipartita]
MLVISRAVSTCSMGTPAVPGSRSSLEALLLAVRSGAEGGAVVVADQCVDRTCSMKAAACSALG